MWRDPRSNIFECVRASPEVAQPRSPRAARGAAPIQDCCPKYRHCVHGLGRQSAEFRVLPVEHVEFVINTCDSIGVGLCIAHSAQGRM